MVKPCQNRHNYRMGLTLEDIPEIPIQEVRLSNYAIDLLRLDLIHPDISGNKWFKLKYNIRDAQTRNKSGILTFGGAFSNHIAATAAACKLAGIPSVGIIRGEKVVNPTLKKAMANGMKIEFLSRSEYREKERIPWGDQYPNFHVVPEGGSNEMGVKGASEIMALIPKDYNYVCLAVGTGGTMAGMIRNHKGPTIVGFPVLKDSQFLEDSVSEMSPDCNHWKMAHGHHQGGYAKINPELRQFMRIFYKFNSITLDPVYTAKLLCGIEKELDKGSIRGKILAIHTGGLQGIEGMEMRLGERLI